MIGDTIQALASPPGSSARAVLRLSGPHAFAAVEAVFTPAVPRRRCQCSGAIRLAGATLPALVLAMPAPASYTGEDVVELHVPGSPLLVAELQRQMAAAIGPALRGARPGEFTARACCNGKLDGAQVEGVLLLIHADDAAAVAAGAAWLTGGLSAIVAGVRARLQDALAWIETGLDFEAADTGAVDAAQWREPLAAVAGDLRALQRQVPMATSGGEVLLLGASNAGKSSLCNALAERDAVLVDAASGTTRDLLRVAIGGDAAVWDAPGDMAEPSAVDRAALELRDRLGGRAAAALLVVDPAGDVIWPRSSLPLLAVAFTKADRAVDDAAAGRAAAAAAAQLRLPAGVPQFLVSAHTGSGVEALRRYLRTHSRTGARAVGAPLREALAAAAQAVERVLGDLGLGAELASLELQQALAAICSIDGSHGPEDLLDRIYARFCLGK